MVKKQSEKKLPPVGGKSSMNPKKQAIELAVAAIEKQYGKGSIIDMGAGVTIPDVQVVRTGSVGLDIALGIGGYPRGRIVEIFGPEATGKSTMALHAIKACQQNGGYALFIDAEHALDLRYAEKIGVKISDLLLSQPDYGEQGLEVAELAIRSGGFDLAVIDSVAALTPRAEIEGEMGDSHMGLQARLMSQACRKLASVANQNKTTVIFINQLRQKIGVMFGNPETTTGGNALKFYSSIRIDLRKKGSIKEGEKVIGNEVKAKVVKNKLYPPFGEAYFDIIFGKGIIRSRELVTLGTDAGVIEKAGAWYSYKEEKLGQGREQAILFLEEHPEIMDEIEKVVIETCGE